MLASKETVERSSSGGPGESREVSAVGASGARQRKPITIVMYHSIEEAPGRYSITPGAFARQMRIIRDRYTVLRARDIGAAFVIDGPASRKVVITFDDAYLDFFDIAYPILEGLGMSCSVFVPTGYLGGFNDWDAPGLWGRRKPLMTTDHIRQLYQTGVVDFGSHTVDHVRMSHLPVAEMRRQAADSKAALEDLLGAPITTFAYPYGQLDDFSPLTTGVIADAGYKTAFTTHWGSTNVPKDILRLRRICFAEDDREGEVRLKLGQWYDWMAVKERAGFAWRRFRKRTRARRRTV